MERFNLSDIMNRGHRDFFQYFIINVLSSYCDKHNLNILETFKLSPPGGELPPGEPRPEIPVEIEFRVNGVDVSLVDFLKLYEEQGDRMVREKAVELLKEKFSTITEVVYNLERRVEDAAKQVLDLYKE